MKCYKVNEDTHFFKLKNRKKKCKEVKNKMGKEICGMKFVSEDYFGEKFAFPRYRCVHQNNIPRKYEKIKGLNYETNLSPYINRKGGKKNKSKKYKKTLIKSKKIKP